jgi:DNA repair protein RecN (Recombination protein N)
MLTSLRIHDFALLDDVELELGPGMNVLTGETGAGKSLLVAAVALLRGGRASAEVVRTGADEARVEAIFEPPHGPAADALAERMAQAGVEPDDEGLIVKRVIGKSGRGRVYLNSGAATVGALAEVAGVLIELAGQHEHQTLSDPARHLDVLDGFAALDDQRRSMAAAFAQLVSSSDALEAASLDERTKRDREEFLRFQVRELEEAAPRPGEEEELRLERDRLRSVEKLVTGARRAEFSLYSREGAIVEELGAFSREFGELGRLDPRLVAIGKQLDEARIVLEDAASELVRYVDSLEANPGRLEEVEDRLHLLGRLLRKHGVETAAALAERRASLEAELELLGNGEARRVELGRALAEARAEAARLAADLGRARRKAAQDLAGRVEKLLAELAMGGARIEVQVTALAPQRGESDALVVDGHRLTSFGWDRVEFLLSANRGEELRPLGKVASGGELSRIMLALKRILSRADQVATYVFDEVDTGIGGSVADVVGRQIRQVADEKQVICITHLAQIAAYADRHFRVEKTTTGGRVRTLVRQLTDEERRDEIARMLGGARITEKARAHADEMLRGAAHRTP